MLVWGVSGGSPQNQQVPEERKERIDSGKPHPPFGKMTGGRGEYHPDVCLVFRPVDILNVASADGAGGDFGLEFAVGGRNCGEEGV